MLLGAASLNAAPASGVTAFVKDHHLTRHSVALIDMNGDNRPNSVINGSTGRLQLGAMKRRILLSIFVPLLVGMSAGWAARDFVAQDRCLDRGGAWSGDLRACELPTQIVR